MTILEQQPHNLENDFLLGLRNQSTIADVFAQIKTKSKILPNIKVINVEGDLIKIVGLKSNEPKEYDWNYKEQEFAPSEVVIHQSQFTKKDKLIFYTVFNESIEKFAVGLEKAALATAEQTEQVSSKVASFYDREFALKYASDDKRYNEEAIISLNAEQLKDVRLVGEILITTGYQMTAPSRRFNLQKDECNVEDTKKILLFMDFSLYARMRVASIYTNPSPVLRELEEIFTVIPVNMANNFQAALIDGDALYLAEGLNKRYLKLDEYVAAHKLLDHIWRKWIFVDFRPAFAIKYDEKAKDFSSTSGTLPSKNILTDFADFKDNIDTMTDAQAKEWNKLGFSYNQAQDWINAGLKVSDAKFANWFVNTKGGDYVDPSWVLNNAGKSPTKTIDDLRTEAGA